MAKGGVVQSPPGEANSLLYRARGVGVVIAPWNFPLAIPTGMVAAALVTGNTVCFKPAEQTPLVAHALYEALIAGGLPPGCLAMLPGVGEEVGAHLVEHPDVAFVTFTGSKAVGLGIIERAAIHRPGQRQVKRVVAEMGGKNALVVDADADLDQAVPAAVYSAFGYAGQKCSACSRLIVVDAVHDEVVERLVGATRVLRMGHPRHMGTQVGPLIDADAHKRVVGHVEAAPSEGTVVLARDDVPEEGFFVGPTIVTEVQPQSRLAREEIFGPVLAVLRAGSFEDGRSLLPFARQHPRCRRGASGRQRVRQPHDGRRRCRPAALRGLRPLGRGFQGRWARLPHAVPGAARRHREHASSGFRAGERLAPARLAPCQRSSHGSCH